MSHWFRNGEPVTTVAIDDRAFQYGDGLFETIAIRGGEPRLWHYHMERLARGCERLALAMPDVDTLRDELQLILDGHATGSGDSIAKIILSSGRGPRGYGRAPGQAGAVSIGLFDYESLPRPAYLDGIDTVVCDTRLASGSAIGGLKTLNRLEQVLGRNECLAADAFEGLMLDGEGRVICGTMSNVFMVSDKSVISPSVDRCGVAGVMRRLLLQTLAEQGISSAVANVSLADFWNSDEVFLTNSQFGVLPVRRCDGHQWPVGSITRQCQNLLAGAGITECAL